MRIEGFQYPKSSFLSSEKDMNLILDKMFKNERLKRLLYYTTKDALERPDITEEQMISMIGKNIKTVPKLYVDGSVLNYIIVSFDGFVPSDNPEFRDNIIEFDIICHFDQWQLKDFALRPYKIAGELDSMFDGQKLTGIGKIEFLGANQIILTDEYAGLCVMYRAVHGGEDKAGMPTPQLEEQFLKDFSKYLEA